MTQKENASSYSHASFSSGLGVSETTQLTSSVDSSNYQKHGSIGSQNNADNGHNHNQNNRYNSSKSAEANANLASANQVGSSSNQNSYSSTSQNNTTNSKNSGDSLPFAASPKLKTPFIHDEELAKEVLAKAGPANTYQRKDHTHDIGCTTVYETGCISKTTSKENLVTNGPGHIYHDYTHTTTTEYNFKSASFTNFDENCANLIKIDDDLTVAGIDSLSSNTINQDPDPIHIMKPNTQNVVYKQQVNIRYLQPPTPPPPAPIIIREKQLPTPLSQPPIIIRQMAPAPPTPVPLIIREKAPTPPEASEPTIIEVNTENFHRI